jgi:Ca-activated chloride channel family protein
VIDPTGETADYGVPRSSTGGHVSDDFTDGYGPEVFTIRRPLPGTYVVKAHWYGDSQQKLAGPAMLQAEFLTGFAAPGGKRETAAHRVESEREVIEIGRFTVR